MKAVRALIATTAILLGFLSSPARAADPISAEDLAKVKAAEKARIEVIDRVYGTVVAIYGNDRSKGGGSGVLYNADGFVVTNFHVVAAAGDDGWAGLADGKLYRWKLYGLDPGGDLAVIKLEGKDKFPFAHFADSDTVRVGDWAIAMGNPFVLAEDQKPTVTLGIVSGVERYQPGDGGKNFLVYGNCIQIDTSINPGNSGGPLFNMAGRVIGINGRGSFEERGRVNVGVGYAISAEQVKNFLPELEATKVVMHSTLDATFRDREDKVICDAVDLMRVMGKAGLEPEDTLLFFNGHRITSAAQIVNLVSMLPPGWPVQVVWNHDGQKVSKWVRVASMPYEPEKKQPKPAAAPGGAPRPGADSATAAPPPQPALPPGFPPGPGQPGQPGRPQMQPQMPQVPPGQIRDPALNRTVVARIFRDWTSYRGGEAALSAVKAWKLTEDVFVGREKIGSQTLLVASDGRVKIRALDRAVERELFSRFGQNPIVPMLELAGMGLQSGGSSYSPLAAVMFHNVAVADFRKIELVGADKTQNQRSYRITAEGKHGGQYIFWFSLLKDRNEFENRFLKASMPDGMKLEKETALAFFDYRPVGGVMVPHRRQVVEGIAEMPVYEVVTQSMEPLSELPAEFAGEKNDATTQPATQPAP